MVGFGGELRGILLCYGKEHEDDYLYEELIKSVDDIIALFISKGWVSPENAAKAQKVAEAKIEEVVMARIIPSQLNIN